MTELSIPEVEKKILSFGSAHLGVFDGEFQGGIEVQQFSDEIGPAIHRLLQECPQDAKSFLEVGSAAGGTTFLFDHFFEFSNIVLIDDNKHHKAKLRKEILKDVKRNELIGNCHDKAIQAMANHYGPYDIIFIDACHDYEDCRMDVEDYSPMLCKGGFLVFHDSMRTEFGVWRVMDEMKEDDRFEFIDEFMHTGDDKEPCGVAIFKIKSGD